MILGLGEDKGSPERAHNSDGSQAKELVGEGSDRRSRKAAVGSVSGVALGQCSRRHRWGQRVAGGGYPWCGAWWWKRWLRGVAFKWLRPVVGSLRWSPTRGGRRCLLRGAHRRQLTHEAVEEERLGTALQNGYGKGSKVELVFSPNSRIG
jgi:hypothetical protein